jgi:molybdopterin molybdotransferase
MRDNDLIVSFEEAHKIVLNSATALGSESINILEATDRILYDDIVSNIMIPPLDSSARDGYAIIADDTQGASVHSPVRLKIIGEIQAGSSGIDNRVSKGTAIRIMTGAPMPEGADAVVQFEDTKEEGGIVTIFCQATKYENYRNAGENIRRGEGVLYKGNRLSSADVGILASLNYNTVKVYKQPTVSIISTGDELAGIGEEIQLGKIRDVNAYALYSEVKKYNALPTFLGIAKDTMKDVRDIFSKALRSDVVISTGGVSMGKYDFVRDIYGDLNIEMQFERVNVKPGKPCALGIRDKKLFFGLPGNPVSALTSFIQFVRPALLKLMGATKISKPIVSAVLEEGISKRQSGNVYLLRGLFTIKNKEFYVSTTGSQKSSIFQSMSNANCLIIIPPGIAKIEAGEKVAIQLIDHDEI